MIYRGYDNDIQDTDEHRSREELSVRSTPVSHNNVRKNVVIVSGE